MNMSKSVRKHDSLENIDEVVDHFLADRAERIAIRRGRVAEAIARKNENQAEACSIASSLEFLSGAEEKSGPSSGRRSADGGRRKSKDGKSTSGSAEASDEIKKTTVDSLDVQIEESRKQLEQIILDGERLITNVRIASECREKVRHTKQSENRKERLDRLREESDECQEMYEALKPNWDLKAEKTLPLDLYTKVKAQQDACEELLTKKQDLIISLTREIEENDFEYETNLEKYQKDVSLLGDRIDDCTDDLQSAFLNELNLIEDYTCRTREVLLKENQREWMDLLEDFETMEKDHLEDRKKDALNKFKILNELYITVKQECRAMRHKFEDDNRILIQELEQLKYATQLNMEKLQYNLAIIRKRYKENIEMKNMMKRLLLKFNDRFTNKSRLLKAKMEAGKKEAKKIINEISKLEESLQQFGRKTLHLAVADHSKYMDLWIVNEEIVRERLQKLLDSEKFICETQLGIESPMPELVFMDERPDTVSKYMHKKSAAYSDLSQSQTLLSSGDKKKKRSSTTDEVDEDTVTDSLMKSETSHQQAGCQPNASLLLLPSESIEFIPGPEPDPVIQRRLMKHVAKVICDESGFIVEEEMRKLLDPLIETERNLVNLDALLKALGINTVSEMQYLAHFLLKRCRVTKGLISRIGSDESAHLSEMNVSLEGILGKNAVDDFETESESASRSKSPSPRVTLEEQNLGSDEEHANESVEFEECLCPRKSGDADDVESLQVLLAPPDNGKGLNEPPGEVDVCAMLPELTGLDGDALSLDDFSHAPVQCSPKCCSSEQDTLEEAIFAAEGDEDLEEMLNIATQADGEEDREKQAKEAHSKCSTCGGEPHDHKDCSFLSDRATVLSWVDEEDPPNQNLKELQNQIMEEEAEMEIAVVESQAVEPFEESTLISVESFLVLPKRSGFEEEDTFIPAVLTAPPEVQIKKVQASVDVKDVPEIDPSVEALGEPVRVYDELQPAEMARKSMFVQKTVKPEDEDETETVSIPSLESGSNGSEEFMYIESNEVIDALTEFCKDYNAKITVQLPTLDELIDKKLKTFKYPKQSTIMEYWERPVRVLNAKSDDLWDTMQYCFEQYNKSLKGRNDLVQQVTQLYQQNFELSHLMQKHLKSAEKFQPAPPPTRPGYKTSNMKYC